ncbi:DNA pilot protein [Peromfec virus RodF5_17]|uniref:DNA pilot protein n=1 Tax=Peromfec virus RodF5_17 TaxID=2929338 RepID=A0A976N260_9VIRU|nr:DNA pilot protein [Peromfec virus RodF5_17]
MPHQGGAPYESNGSFLDDLTGFFDNMFTGRRDYNRQVALNEYQASVNAAEAQKARDFNSQEAQKTRDYNTEMSNTAIQRAAADYSAAGFNPAAVLSSGGAGYSGGVSASGSAASAGLASAHDTRNYQLMDKILTTANTAVAGASQMAREVYRAANMAGFARAFTVAPNAAAMGYGSMLGSGKLVGKELAKAVSKSFLV